MLSIFHVPIGHLYAFFGKTSVSTRWGASSSRHYKKVHQSDPHLLIWPPLSEVFLLGSFTSIPETPLTENSNVCTKNAAS